MDQLEAGFIHPVNTAEINSGHVPNTPLINRVAKKLWPQETLCGQFICKVITMMFPQWEDFN